jgi:hypothetical protein
VVCSLVNLVASVGYDIRHLKGLEAHTWYVVLCPRLGIHTIQARAGSVLLGVSCYQL